MTMTPYNYFNKIIYIQIHIIYIQQKSIDISSHECTEIISFFNFPWVGPSNGKYFLATYPIVTAFLLITFLIFDKLYRGKISDIKNDN